MQNRENRKPRKDLKGQRFGKLEVLDFRYFKGKYPYWHCKCECGTEKDIYQSNLLSGATKSCGCERKACGEKLAKQNLHIYQGVQIEKTKAKLTQKNNTTGFRGVYLDKKSGKYRARIILQGKRTELGYFQTKEEAIKARLKAEQKTDQIIAEYKAKTQRNLNIGGKL